MIEFKICYSCLSGNTSKVMVQEYQIHQDNIFLSLNHVRITVGIQILVLLRDNYCNLCSLLSIQFPEMEGMFEMAEY